MSIVYDQTQLNQVIHLIQEGYNIIVIFIQKLKKVKGMFTINLVTLEGILNQVSLNILHQCRSISMDVSQ
jgi:hypothetical protein